MPIHPELPEDEKKFQARRVHDRAMADALEAFMRGQLMNDNGDAVDSRKEAMVIAEGQAKKAVQNLKKTGADIDVFVHSR